MSCRFASLRVALAFLVIGLLFEKLWVTISTGVFSHAALIQTLKPGTHTCAGARVSFIALFCGALNTL